MHAADLDILRCEHGGGAWKVAEPLHVRGQQRPQPILRNGEAGQRKAAREGGDPGSGIFPIQPWASCKVTPLGNSRSRW